MSAPTFTIGGWRANPQTLTLTTVGRSIRIEPKAMAVLELLASRAPEVVSKEELFETVWPGVVVGENALHRVIRVLRQALDDSARNPKYIEAVPRSGYRLLVTPQDGSERRSAPRRPLGELAIQVRPRSGNRDSLDICSDVGKNLTWSSGAVQILRGESERELDYQVEVEVESEREGPTIVSWELWSQTPQILVSSSEHADPFFRQRRRRIAELVAEGIAESIRKHRRDKLDEMGDIDRLTYWDLLLLSDHYRSMDKDHVQTRRRMLQRAIAIHPHIAPAHAAYGDFLSWEIANGIAEDNRQNKQQVLTEIAMALDLDPRHPYTLTRCGTAYSRIGEFDRGVELCRSACEVAPSVFCKDLLARSLTYAGEPEEAIRIFEDIQTSLPSGQVFQLGRIVVPLVQLGRLSEALAYLERSLTMFPKDYFAWALKANILAQQGKVSVAQDALDHVFTLMPQLRLNALIQGTARTYGRFEQHRRNLTEGLELLRRKAPNRRSLP